MKENAIKKINSMGKIAGIFVIIARVLVCIGFAGCIIGIIALAVLPEGFITIKTKGDVDVVVDMEAVNVKFDEAERLEIQKQLESEASHGNFQINGQNFGEAKVVLEGNKFLVNAGGQMNDLSLKKLIGVIAMAAVNVVCAFVTLLFAGFLCKAFKECQSPFEDKVIKSMRNLAFAIIPWVFMSSVSESIATAFFTGVFTGGDTNIRFEADFSVIFAVILIFGLTYIFKYGAMLQQESDETL